MRSLFHFLSTLSIVMMIVATAATCSAQECASCESQEPAPCVDGSCTNICSGGGCLSGLGSNLLGGLLGGGSHCPEGNCGYGESPSLQNQGCCWYRPFTEQSQADLFYNYYAPNNYGSSAASFPAPFPTPTLVGHTYYTYQPLMPNEFLYTHRRVYNQYYNNGMGWNRTKVAWYHNPLNQTFGSRISLPWKAFHH